MKVNRYQSPSSAETLISESDARQKRRTRDYVFAGVCLVVAAYWAMVAVVGWVDFGESPWRNEWGFRLLL